MESTIPTFSIFSAISEVFVTIGVLYAIITNVRGKPLNWKVLGSVLAFELCVNVVYMAGRASAADKGVALTTTMKIFYAGHGILSLLMFLALVIVFLLCIVDMANERDAWFSRHPRWSWVMVFFWMVSVTTGEAIFVMRYLV